MSHRSNVWFISFFYFSGDHRYLHVLTHSYPTLRSSDLVRRKLGVANDEIACRVEQPRPIDDTVAAVVELVRHHEHRLRGARQPVAHLRREAGEKAETQRDIVDSRRREGGVDAVGHLDVDGRHHQRSEEHTSELQSLMR